MGTLQAVEAVKQLTGAGETLVNKILLFDAMELDINVMDIGRESECALCGHHPTIQTIQHHEAECEDK